MFRGEGTVINVVAVLIGSGIGVAVGHRLPQRTRNAVTDALGLVTLLIAALAAMAVTDSAFTSEVGPDAPVLIVLGSLLIGGIAGSLAGIELRLEAFGGWLQSRLSRRETSEERVRFIEGFVSASLVFCVGPLTVLGSLNDGLGNGSDQLVLKSVLDGFAAIAFAASLGIGVMASAIAVLAVQGSLTVVGLALGSFLPDAHLAALTATGGLLLAGVGIRLLQLKALPVADLLPALIVAPILTEIVVLIR
ncbi:DUF554 domain-containing protein [Solicola gregarius]|uniref:DUF554 domain-containing protein n=1 Tax=Solicola gregarius TaxID=2908642 RepID=A0AA46THD3_9ACTN|nr:DUF554 domain-containing protein [Solicola gregarius]UYM05305.1 DUF554 domain-containing protein [Solicola gregarius]